jgi:hypothetical protein
VTFYYYDAEHSLMNEKLPALAVGAAAMAWDRIVRFFRTLEPQRSDCRKEFLIVTCKRSR